MAVLLFLLVIGGSCLLLWGIIYTVQQARARRDPDRQFQEAKIKLLSHLRRHTTSTPKINIITGLEFTPKYFKELVQSLIADGLIIETDANIEITNFGKQYYDTFITRL